MELIQILTMLAFALNGFGIMILYRYGSSPVDSSAVGYIYNQKEAEDIRKKENDKKAFYNKMKLLGLLLSVLGLVFGFVAFLVQNGFFFVGNQS